MGFTRDELKAKPFTEFIHPDDVEPTFKEVEKQLNKQQIANFVNRYRCKNGEYKWLDWVAILSPNGKNLYAAARDITEKKQAEIELTKARQIAKENETKYKLIANNTNDCIWALDENLIFTYMPPATVDLFGYTIEEWKTLDWSIFVHPDYIKQVVDVFDDFKKKKVNNILPLTILVRRKDRSEMWIEFSASAIYNSKNEYKGTIGISRDVTQRKEIEIQLIKEKKRAEENEKKFRSYIENAPDAVFLINESGKFIDVNKAASRITGYSINELLNHSLSDLIIEEDSEKEAKQFQEVKETGISRGELGFLTKIKEKKYWSIDIVKLSEIRFIGFAKEITDKIRFEQELIFAKEKAVESNRLKTEFINNMSHEIRTPINGILGFSDLLNKENLSKEKSKLYTNIIQNSSLQLLHVIDDIMEISRLGTKQIKVFEKRICLNYFLLELFSIFDVKAKEIGIPLYFKKGLSDMKSTILTDDSKLNKIVSNLLENALKYTNEGFIEFGYQLKNTAIVIYVKDTGIGIKSENQNIIFDRFSQEENRLSKNIGGLGLGLSIAKENAELLGGKITLKSDKGKGATFFVTIPYKPVYSKREINNNDEIRKEKESYNILIAEDEEVNYLYMEMLLEDEIDINCKILHAKNGKDAVDICKEKQEIDLVLLDLKMPIMNGFEAAKIIKHRLSRNPYTSKYHLNTKAT